MSKSANFCAHLVQQLNGFVKPFLGAAALLALALATGSSQAVLMTYEGFPYTATGPMTIDGQNGGTNWDAAWGQFLGGAQNYIVTNNSLADVSGLLNTGSN